MCFTCVSCIVCMPSDGFGLLSACVNSFYCYSDVKQTKKQKHIIIVQNRNLQYVGSSMAIHVNVFCLCLNSTHSRKTSEAQVTTLGCQ